MPRSAPNYQTTDVVPYGTGRRLTPPDSLGDRARAAFIDLTTSVPSNHFRSSDLSLLCGWSEMVALAERCAFEMEQPHGVVGVDGKATAWVSAHASATKILALLALRLRLGPQQRVMKAPKREPSPVSYYDRMRLEKGFGEP
jgi:hypothetical protein